MDETKETAGTQTEDTIRVENLHKTYQLGNQRVDALRGVQLRVTRGQIVAVTGKSGSGKSTLLHMIGTLDRPTEGRVLLDGVDTGSLNDQAASSFRNKKVGFVFQMNNLLHEFSAVENVMLPGLIAGGAKDQVRERAEVLLKAVGLGERLSHRPGELSGGEQQRVAIARALLMAPPILLADEPTGNLDQKTSLGIQELLMRICVENRVTMLLVTHDPDLAKRMPHHVLMEDGRVMSGSQWS